MTGDNWLGVKRESKPGPVTPHPGPLRDQHGRPIPPRNPYRRGTLAHSWRELALAVDDLRHETRLAVERIAYRVARAIRRNK